MQGDTMFDPNHLWPHPTKAEFGTPFRLAKTFTLKAADRSLLPAQAVLQDLERIAGVTLRLADSNDDRDVSDEIAESVQIDIESIGTLSSREEYRLKIDSNRCSIVSNGSEGVMYALVTFAQIIALSSETAHGGNVMIPAIHIEDVPCYAKRCFMADMGRSVFSIAFLERLIRVLAQLKMNQLHLHLHDDELCGIRYPNLPFGTENPFAIELEDLGRLIEYASQYNVEIVPELEGWGHVGSLVYHRPELRGGPGMYGGASFKIGPDSFSCMEEIIDGIASVLPDGGAIHLGLDEANWVVSDTAPDGYAPSDMVGRYWELITTAGQKYGKRFDFRLWADHAGRPVPKEIEEHLIIEPWQYWNEQRPAIDRAIGRYAGAGKMRFMMGAGQSVAQHRGAFHATRYWAMQAMEVPNVLGGNITFWGANNIDENFLSLFAGSYYLWNPRAKTPFCHTEDYESYDRIVAPIMEKWQTLVSDARPDLLRIDRGPMVRMGRYVWGSKHGMPVAPTVTANEHAADHDFLNET